MTSYYAPGRLCHSLVISLILFTSLLAQKQSVRVGIVMDGPSRHEEALVNVLQDEIQSVLEDQYEVVFPTDRILKSDWSREDIQRKVEQLIQGPGIDVLIATGLTGSQELSQQGPLPKPAFGLFVLDPALQGLPSSFREIQTLRPGEVEAYRASGVRNLNYLLYGDKSANDVQQFKEIISFSKLAILVPREWLASIRGFGQAVSRLLEPARLERIDVVGIGSSAREALTQIQSDVGAVIVLPLFQLSDSEFDSLIRGLNERRLPTLSMVGRSELEKGLLLTFYPQENPVKRARRIALNIQEALGGGDPGEMSIEFQRERKLVINMATARQIGLSPRYKVLLEAELLNDTPAQPIRTISLSSVVREASTMNLDLLAADRKVLAGQQSVLEARAPLLPQIGLSGNLSVLDADRARTFPTLSETEWSASLDASQLIYSDRAWAGYGIEKSFQIQREEQRAQIRLDVIDEAARAYLNLLRAQTIERIQKENLDLTRSNLELASSRVQIGVAGREEVFRWQSQVATNQRDLIDAEAARRQARISVNRILNRPLNEEFGTVETRLDDPEFVASFATLDGYIDNPEGFRTFSEFMAGEALSTAPEIRQFEAAIRARQRELQTEERSFFLPDFWLGGGVKSFQTHGIGSELPAGLNNTDWFVGINARIPLFEGGARYSRVHRIRLQLEELSLQRDAASLRVEERVRTRLEASNASFIGIDLSLTQAEAARKNLALVKDSYAAGVVGILALLDAQNAALVADLIAANAVFQYLSDLMALQRSVGHFDYFRTPEERQSFLSRLDQFFRERGILVRNP